MKLKDTFMSSPIYVKTLKYQCVPKNFLLLCRQFFSFHNLEADNFFQPTTFRVKNCASKVSSEKIGYQKYS